MVSHFTYKFRLINLAYSASHDQALRSSQMLFLLPHDNPAMLHSPLPVPLAVGAHAASGPLCLPFPWPGCSSPRSSPGCLLITQHSAQALPSPMGFPAYPNCCCPLLPSSHSLPLYPVLFSWRYYHYMNWVIGLFGYCLSRLNRIEAP